MTKNEQFFKDLSFKYFRGEVSVSEERRLFSWLKEEDGRMDVFHGWEDEWKGTAAVLDPKWEQMLGRIAAREVLDASDVTPRKGMSPWWGAVAAALVAVAGSLFLLTRPAPVREFALEAPAGEKSRVFLPDSSVVWLNSGSKLYFDNSFGHKERMVALVGEGFFDITHNEKVPFRVTCGNDVSILVKGTKFNVSAYPEDRYVNTSVVEGHVVFSHALAHLDLYKGQSARFDSLSGGFSRSEEKPENASAWTESRFVYDGITLSDLAEKLSRTYAVRFHFNTTEYLDQKFNISLRNNESLSEVLSALEMMIPVKARIDGDNVYIDKK